MDDEEEIAPPTKKKKVTQEASQYGQADFDYELAKYSGFSKNIKKRQIIIKKILSQYPEFKDVDHTSIEANLIVQAICQMGSNKAGAAARNFVSEKARLLSPAQGKSNVTISFWNPLEVPEPPKEEKPDGS